MSSILNLGANATLVMTLGDIGQVFVRGKVDEADIGFVRLGMPARITTESFRDQTFSGKVTQISLGLGPERGLTPCPPFVRPSTTCGRTSCAAR